VAVCGVRHRAARPGRGADQPAGPRPGHGSQPDGAMMTDAAFGAFAAAYEQGRSQIVFRRVVADLETPIGAYLKLAAGRKNTFLLESVQDGATRGRYSMIGLDPDIILKVERGEASINRNA